MIVARLLYAAVALTLLGSIPREPPARRAAEGGAEAAPAQERSANDAWTARPTRRAAQRPADPRAIAHEGADFAIPPTQR